MKNISELVSDAVAASLEVNDERNFSERNLMAFSKAIDKKIEARNALCQALVELPDEFFGLKARTSGGKLMTLNNSAQRPGFWQTTRFDDEGLPWGDTQYPTKKMAIAEFLQDCDLSKLVVEELVCS